MCQRPPSCLPPAGMPSSGVVVPWDTNLSGPSMGIKIYAEYVFGAMAANSYSRQISHDSIYMTQHDMTGVQKSVHRRVIIMTGCVSEEQPRALTTARAVAQDPIASLHTWNLLRRGQPNLIDPVYTDGAVTIFTGSFASCVPFAGRR